MLTCRLVLSGVCLAAILTAATSMAAAKKESAASLAPFDPLKQFEHIGIFTAEKKPNERFVTASKVWVTDFQNHPYGVEWLRTDRPFGGPNPHVAFRVDSIEKAAAAAKGLKCVSKPFDAGIARVAFYRTDDGAVVEFMEYYKEYAKQTPRKVQFDHIGLITTEKKPNETFVAATKVWVTDIAAHPYRVEWLRFEPDSAVKGPVREQPHVAFRVDSIAQAAKGLKVLIEPFDAGIAKVGFYQADDGAVVEFMEYHKKGTSGGDLIRRENQKAGTSDWQLTYVQLDKPGTAGFRSPGIEGYCSRQSVAAGEPIEFFVSTEPAVSFTLEIFRMGYYGGQGARLMKTLGPLTGKTQGMPPVGPRRIRECRWEPSARLVIPADWPSGVYLGRLSRVPNPDGTMPWQSYVVFVVRDDRPADILFQCPDNTWQAYNRWPDNYSLYIDPQSKLAYCSTKVDVSFDRPYGKYVQIYENPQSVGSGEFLCWEFPLCYWLEQHGYDVSYCSNSDMLAPDRAAKCKAFISVGHDEYWDLRQYESVLKISRNGTSVLFLSGNAVCYVTPFRPGADGRPNRILSRKGPFQGLTMGKEPPQTTFDYVGPDEGLLLGARNILPVNGGGDWVCAKPEHWMFAGTGMKKGDRIRGLVGWEFHSDPPPIKGLEVVAEGIALHGGTRPVPYQATIYPTAKGGFVFNASTIFWSLGLSAPPGHMPVWSHNTRPNGPDPRVQQITRNLLRRAVER